MADGDHRHKVTLALDNDDVKGTIGTMLEKSGRAKFIDWPSAVYSMHPFDKVTVDGETVGVSTWIGYSANEGKMLTLAVLDAAYAEPGTEVTFVWGEAGRRLDASRRSSGTCRRSCARSSVPSRTSRRCARSTRPAAGARRPESRGQAVAAASGDATEDQVGGLLGDHHRRRVRVRARDRRHHRRVDDAQPLDAVDAQLGVDDRPHRARRRRVVDGLADAAAPREDVLVRVGVGHAERRRARPPAARVAPRPRARSACRR